MLGEDAATILNLASRLGIEPAALLVSAWRRAENANNDTPDFDRIIEGVQNEDTESAAMLVMNAITINATYKSTLVKAA